MTNLYGVEARTSGIDITKLTARLDGLLLTLKSCAGKTCREPWRTLFPDGRVNSLRDALHPKYDEFFIETLEKVTFSECLGGYITSAEGALAPVPYSATQSGLRARWHDFV